MNPIPAILFEAVTLNTHCKAHIAAMATAPKKDQPRLFLETLQLQMKRDALYRKLDIKNRNQLLKGINNG